MLKVLHGADFHLDAPFRALREMLVHTKAPVVQQIQREPVGEDGAAGFHQVERQRGRTVMPAVEEAGGDIQPVGPDGRHEHARKQRVDEGQEGVCGVSRRTARARDKRTVLGEETGQGGEIGDGRQPLKPAQFIRRMQGRHGPRERSEPEEVPVVRRGEAPVGEQLLGSQGELVADGVQAVILTST